MRVRGHNMRRLTRFFLEGNTKTPANQNKNGNVYSNELEIIACRSQKLDDWHQVYCCGPSDDTAVGLSTARLGGSCDSCCFLFLNQTRPGGPLLSLETLTLPPSPLGS